MGRIKDGYSWSTFVIVDDHSGTWYQMNIDPNIIRNEHSRHPVGVHIERWTYRRDAKAGDILQGKKRVCMMCFDSGRPGKIINANQWVNCFECNQ